MSQTARPKRVVLLGPQAETTTVVDTLESLEIKGSVGLITAGWHDAEGDPAQIDPALAKRVHHVPLYGNAERVWKDDPELHQGHQAMQRAVRTARMAYNIRLANALNAFTAIASVEGDRAVVDDEQATAFEAVRRLDELHVDRIASLRADYNARFMPEARSAVQKERNEVARIVEPLEAVVVEGGHVAVLINRMRLFDLSSMLAGKTVIGCSGGAMILAERLVLFHDSPPQGPGNAEVAEHGLGLVSGIIPLPHADRRLRLDDPHRVGLFARRFDPSPCVVLDGKTRLIHDQDGWHTTRARRLTTSGSVVAWESAA